MKTKYFYAIMLMVFSLVTPTICIVKKIQFDQDCAGYLKQTADANTAEIALERLNMAIAYIEGHHLTHGYTSVLWKTEDENIAFWYRNLKACQQELSACIGGTQLEKSNVLMKVRESLTDNGGSGTNLTIPDGISRYPDNSVFLFWGIMSIIMFAGGLGLDPERYKTRILLMEGDMPVKSMDIDRLLPNIQEGQIMRVFEKKAKVINISHTIFGRCATMQVIQVEEITADNSAKTSRKSEEDFSRSIKIHNYEVTINHYMEDAIDIIHRVCTSKDVNHKQAREKAIEVCDDCIAFVRKEYEKAKSEGIL